MANTIITPTVVAKMALLALTNNWVFGALVHKDYSKEYKHVGEDVTVRKPATLTAVEFDGDLTGQFQNVTEDSVTLSMDKILTVPVAITSKELTLDIVNFNEQIVIPACQALADKVDSEIAKLYKDIPYYEDCETTTAISDFTAVRKMMSDNKVPNQNRYGVLSPMTFASMLNLSEFRDLEKTGETAVLREASMGRRFGFDLYESQNIQHHSVGEATLEAGTVNGAHAAGAETLAVTSMGTGTITKGSILILTGYSQTYVVTADTLLSATAATLPIAPALVTAVADTTVVTLHGSDADSDTGSKENLFFHKNAFAMISAPMEPPLGGAKGASLAYEGLSLQVVYDYEMTQFKNMMTVSILCGFKTLQSELAVRLYDAS